MAKFSKHKWWIMTVVLTAPIMAVAAAITNFSPQTAISSKAVNDAFSALDDRIKALEGKALPSLSCVVKKATSPSWSVSCDPGYYVTGGGCDVVDKQGIGIKISMPSSTTEWTCDANANLSGIYAICCRIQ